jgi:hypothetical protein
VRVARWPDHNLADPLAHPRGGLQHLSLGEFPSVPSLAPLGVVLLRVNRHAVQGPHAIAQRVLLVVEPADRCLNVGAEDPRLLERCALLAEVRERGQGVVVESRRRTPILAVLPPGCPTTEDREPVEACRCSTCVVVTDRRDR